MKRLRSAALVAAFLTTTLTRADVVLYDGTTSIVDAVLPDPTELWIPTEELTRVTGFELKPEGACLDDICVPVDQRIDSELKITRANRDWFNVSTLAERISQASIADHEAGVWSFSAIPVQRSSFYSRAEAPGFTLEDMNGSTVALSDFKGKKVMLLTWASW